MHLPVGPIGPLGPTGLQGEQGIEGKQGEKGEIGPPVNGLDTSTVTACTNAIMQYLSTPEPAPDQILDTRFGLLETIASCLGTCPVSANNFISDLFVDIWNWDDFSVLDRYYLKSGQSRNKDDGRQTMESTLSEVHAELALIRILASVEVPLYCKQYTKSLFDEAMRQKSEEYPPSESSDFNETMFRLNVLNDGVTAFLNDYGTLPDTLQQLVDVQLINAQKNVRLTD